MQKTQRSGLNFGMVFQRQAWRPPTLRYLESISFGILRRHASLVQPKARLLAWHGQIARRGQTLAWWPRLEMEHLAGQSLADPAHLASASNPVPKVKWAPKDSPHPIGTTYQEALPPSRLQASSAAMQTNAQLQTARAPGLPTNLQARFTSPSEDHSNTSKRAAPIDPERRWHPQSPSGRPGSKPGSPESIPTVKHVAPQLESGSSALGGAFPTVRHRAEQNVILPVIRRSGILQLASGSNSPTQQMASRPRIRWGESSALVPMKKHPEDGEPVTPPEVRPLLIPTVTSSPRQEIRAGFPEPKQAIVLSRPEIGMENSTPTAQGPSMPQLAVREVPRSTNVAWEKQSSVGPIEWDHAKARGSAESAPNGMISSSAFQGVEVHSASAQNSYVGDRSRSAVEGDRAQPPPPVVPPPLPSAPPALDINSLADKVYQTLVRRHRLERERNGLY